MRELKTKRKDKQDQTTSRMKHDTSKPAAYEVPILNRMGPGFQPPERFAPLVDKLSHPANVVPRAQFITKMQRNYGNRYVQRMIKAKLKVSRPDDIYEQEADRIADMTINIPESQLHDSLEREIIKTRKLSSQTADVASGLESFIQFSKGKGQPLSEYTRTFFEPRFGVDFTGVRVHTDTETARINQLLNAEAFTHGQDIYFGAGKSPGKNILTAHELTHIVQQNSRASLPERIGRKKTADKHMSRPISPTLEQIVQRRIYVSGPLEADCNEYVEILGNAAGYRLTRSFRNPRVRIVGNLPGPVPSPQSRARLRTMINHPTQHAEVQVGAAQPRVGIGAFPVAPSMIQLVDIDDIRNLNARVPGAGTAKAYHELVENWHHHAPGTPAFGPSHERGVEMESTVAEELGTPGRRMLGRGQLQHPIPAPAGMPAGYYARLTQEFTTYFLVIIYRVNPGNDWELVQATRNPKVQVSQRTISRFVSGTQAIPAGGNAILNAVVADLNANANSTVAIEGFTDSSGSRAVNIRVSTRRAEEARNYLVNHGIAADRINIVGRGETNFVDTNATAAGRANNRRVVLTVHRPGP